jgi:hypothetical protein
MGCIYFNFTWRKKMNKKLLMGLVLLAIIGTSAVFAQQPTLDKLTFAPNGNPAVSYEARAANQQISGAVVIPDTYNDKPVVSARNFNIAGITSVTFPNSLITIESNAFLSATGLTSVTIPANVATINGAFRNCTNLTSVTFGGSNTNLTGSGFRSFPGDLDAKYNAGGAGTYTRSAGSDTWTKQGGFSLNGTYTRSDGFQITIAENGQNITITGNKPNNGGRLNDTYAKR